MTCVTYVSRVTARARPPHSVVEAVTNRNLRLVQLVLTRCPLRPSQVWERFTYSSLAKLERERRCGTAGWGRADAGCTPPPVPARRDGRPRLDDPADSYLASPHLRGADALDYMLQVLKGRLLQGTTNTSAHPEYLSVGSG